MHRTRVGLGLVLLLGLSACDEDATETDAGVDAGPANDDAGPPEDAGPSDDDAGADDGGPGDAGTLDGGAEPCETAGCDTGQTCVRGVCLDDCGGDPSVFDGALAAGLTPVASFCRAAATFGVAGDTAWDVTTSTAGDTTTFTLSRWPLDPAMTPPSPTEVATAEHTVADGSTLVFAGGFLEIEGARVLFGYTESGADAPGGVFVVDASETPATLEELSAPGNFDAAWLDADTFALNGKGLLGEEVGQGLYVGDVSGTPSAAHVVTGPGEYSGSVAVTADVVVTGGLDATFASAVRAFDRADVEAAITETPLDAATDGFAVTLPDGTTSLGSTFGLLSPTRLLVTPFGGPLTSYTVTWSDPTGLALSAPEELATGDTFTDVMPASEGRLVFVHANGLLLVEE